MGYHSDPSFLAFSAWVRPASPAFYVIDHKGVIRYKGAGPPGEKVVDAALDKLFKAAEAEGGDSPR